MILEDRVVQTDERGDPTDGEERVRGWEEERVEPVGDDRPPEPQEVAAAATVGASPSWTVRTIARSGRQASPAVWLSM